MEDNENMVAVSDGSKMMFDETSCNLPNAERTEKQMEEDKEDTEVLHAEARRIAEKVVISFAEAKELVNLDFLATGGYHHVWRAAYSLTRYDDGDLEKMPKLFVLRIALKGSSLNPFQTRHEVACLDFVARHLPTIPVPKILAWDDGSSGDTPAFMVETFIEGERLSVAWPTLTEDQKTDICYDVANIIADLGETRFSTIGGLTTYFTAGPNIEAAKVFNGRAKFHSPENYNIGPYKDSKDYIISCYDREIFYYANAAKADIVMEAFEETSVMDFVQQLRERRQALLQGNDSVFRSIDAEPLVLVHEDFHAGNMLVRNGKLVAILDWEFSGIYPLSELLGIAQIVQVSDPGRTTTTEDEEMLWDNRYRKEVELVVRQRGWSEQDVKTLTGSGHSMLHVARSCMYPKNSSDSESVRGN